MRGTLSVVFENRVSGLKAKILLEEESLTCQSQNGESASILNLIRLKIHNLTGLKTTLEEYLTLMRK